jgi:hypothetical protein
LREIGAKKWPWSRTRNALFLPVSMVTCQIAINPTNYFIEYGLKSSFHSNTWKTRTQKSLFGHSAYRLTEYSHIYALGSEVRRFVSSTLRLIPHWQTMTERLHITNSIIVESNMRILDSAISVYIPLSCDETPVSNSRLNAQISCLYNTGVKLNMSKILM